MHYLDHNASSSLRECARVAMDAAFTDGGNASSIHAAGRRARARVEAAREAVGRLVDAPAACVVFTSGATEANALALRGAVAGAAAEQKSVTRLYYSAVEHEAVRANAHYLAEHGLSIAEVPVSGKGVMDVDALRALLKSGKGRALISVMAANNENGVVQPLAEVALLAKETESLFHTDAVQAVSRVPFSFKGLDADYASISAHKLGGPQGAGALIVKMGAPMVAQIPGGGQEKRLRSGTENVAAIAGLGAVASLLQDNGAEVARLRAMRESFESQILPLGAVIFGAGAERLPNTSNFAIPGVASELALIALDLDGVCVSSGSACSSGKVQVSHVLSALGIAQDLALGAIRVSFGHSSRDEDLAAITQSLTRMMARKRASMVA